MELPASLRTWFTVHFVVDWLFGIPLLLVPELVLPPLGWGEVDPVSTRLASAALLAIGAQSLRSRNAGLEAYRALLSLKVIWSTAAILGLSIAIVRGAPPATFAFLGLFLAFCGVWSHYAIRLRQIAGAPDAELGGDDPGADDQVGHRDGG